MVEIYGIVWKKKHDNARFITSFYYSFIFFSVNLVTCDVNLVELVSLRQVSPRKSVKTVILYFQSSWEYHRLLLKGASSTKEPRETIFKR